MITLVLHEYDVSHRKGFTLIELIVVIAIISFLVTIAVTSYSNARRNARDSQRQGNIAQVRLAIELYLDDIKNVPRSSPTTDCSGATQDPTVAGWNVLMNQSVGLRAVIGGQGPWINTVLQDPLNDASLNLQFKFCSPGTTMYKIQYKTEADNQVVTIKNY